METKQPNGWYSRGYLPHFDKGRVTQSITFRLVDSYPRALIERMRAKLSLADLTDEQYDLAWRKQAQHVLHKNYGACWLRDPEVAEVVQNCFQYHDGSRYDLHAWCVMPNHCHVLITQYPNHALGSVLHTWRSFTAHKANEVLGRTGPFWARGSFDRYIRNERHFGLAVDYIERNPVAAGLCFQSEDWPFGSAFFSSRVPVTPP